MTLRVQRKTCATCIFTHSMWREGQLETLLDEIRDPRMAGFFTSFRVCHHSRDAVCAGFWARHRDDFQAGQLAQRLNLVEFVHDDTLTTAEPETEDDDA